MTDFPDSISESIALADIDSGHRDVPITMTETSTLSDPVSARQFYGSIGFVLRGQWLYEDLGSGTFDLSKPIGRLSVDLNRGIKT
jgi:hypothetical protein